MDYKDNNTDNQHTSKLVFDEQVIAKIVAMAIKGQDGITTVKSNGAFSGIVGRGNESSGINVEVGETEVAVDLRLWLEFGKNAREIYTRIKEVIEAQVMSMTGLKVVEVNAKIEDVLSPDEFRDRLNG
ncbi:alkaline-shock protein [Peptostreptococcus sp. MV1]|uniref:Asp23/Gls24 family envelope stress response protein n=1 Tax=Peptostreptococcus sp. MV1 TaxID=1219626 RepID=UPI00050D9EF7|nr:Asp23/Gls24 family envelope stress response protein [Peptostreptococcus sp. MV1]KGF12883.1 alkaline-shock protein [Peptostreptococcus sp. MV1]